MLTRKFSPRGTALRSAQTGSKPNHTEDSRSRDVPEFEASALEIDHENEVDCDPYNRTGQFCVGSLRPKHD